MTKTIFASRSMRVAFRVDASVHIGTGHVMRCLALAAWLRRHGAECLFLCRSHVGNLADAIWRDHHRVHLLEGVGSAGVHTTDTMAKPYQEWLGVSWSEDAMQTVSVLEQFRPDWLVVDHYALGMEWERLVRPFTSRIFAIDDLAGRSHDCDFLLDQTLGRLWADYAPRVPDTCVGFMGPKYALLRTEFAAARDRSLGRREAPRVERILVTMGGVDLPNTTSKVLQALDAIPLPDNCRIVVVLGASSPWADDVRRMAGSLRVPVSLDLGTTRMADLMAESDFAIGAAGSTSWERCCLGLPGAICVIADNQRKIASELVDAGAAVALQLREDGGLDGMDSAASVLFDPTRLNMMSQIAAGICDGRGVQRVGEAMCNA